MNLRSSITCAMCMFVFAAAPFAGAQGPVTVTDTGSYTGISSESNPTQVRAYLGIRYAAPPTGTARWTPPTAPVRVQGVQAAVKPGYACPQPQATETNEDCLFLNVYVPANADPHADLPVFFFIHGGDFLIGTGSVYDPSSLVAENNIIAVTINYRLGALGWLAEPSLAAKSANVFQQPGDSGNYGLMDQEFALDWVYRNVAAFGGSPNKITLAGQSAGGLSIYNILESPTVGPQRFRGAIIESAARTLNDSPSLAEYEQRFDALFNQAVGCEGDDNADCLRALDANSFANADVGVFGLNFSPVSGTRIAPLPPLIALRQGRYVHVPILQGTNANEGRLYEPILVPPPPSGDGPAAGGSANYYLTNFNSFCGQATGQSTEQVCTYQQEIGTFLGLSGFPAAANTPDFANVIADLYPLITFPDPLLQDNAPSADEGLAQIFTDFTFSCKSVEADMAVQNYSPGRTFGYEFDDPDANPGPGVASVGFPTASEHTAELRYLFTYADNNLTANQEQLATQMRAYWGNFVISGNPNAPRQVPRWLPFDSPQTKQHLIPAPGVSGPDANFESDHSCSIWNKYLPSSGPLGPIVGPL